MKKLFILSILTLSGLCHISAKEMFYEINSPDRRICFSVKTDSGQQPAYKISVDGNDVIDWSVLGFSYGETNAFSLAEIKPRSMRPKKVNKVWRPLWGKRSAVKDAYNTWSFSIPIGADLLYGSSAKGPKTNATLEVRVYNEGAAFRVYMPTSRAIYMLNFEAARSLSREEMQIPIVESTEFNFAGDYTAWYYNGERHNIGPEKLSDAGGERLPIMTIRASDELYLALHEAHLDYDGWPMRLRTEAGSTKFNVIPEKIETNGLLFPGAWRVIMVGRTPGDLVDSHLIELLNPEPEMDFSWVRPGVYLWDWRIDGAVWEGYRYGMNYDSWVRMIDFAAEQGFQGLLLDANWYGPEFEKDSDPTKGDKARDVQRIIKYGKDKGVGVWLYLNDVAGTNYPIEETLAQYGEWGPPV